MARFIRTKDNKLYDTEYYGDRTWGSTHQESIIQKRKHYYFHTWIAGDSRYDDCDDTTYETKINVVKESNNIEDVVDEIKTTASGTFAFINGQPVAMLENFTKNNYWFDRGTDWSVFTEEELKCVK